MTLVPPPARCGHCGRDDVAANLPGGYATVGEIPLCHPDSADRPNCYVLVTVFHHDPANCGPCRVAGITKES